MPQFAWAQPATGAHPIDLFELGAPAFATFGPRDGVPESVIVAVQTDRDGFVWLTSPQGLARYDGHRWSALEDPAMSGSISNLLVDHEGTLWAASHDLGIAHYDGARWQLETRASGLPTEHIRRVAETRDSAGRFDLWALTFDGGLLHRQQGQWLSDPSNSQLPAGVLAIARTHALGGHERLWVGTFNEGVWFQEDGVWRPLRDAHFDPSQVEHLLVTEHEGREELWISTFGAGLWRLDDTGLRAWNLASGDLPTDSIYDLVQTTLPNGERIVWAASRAGLVRVYKDRAQVFDRRHGLPSDVVRGLSVWRSPDGIDVLWLATEAGVARTVLGSSQWQTASLLGAHSSGVFSVLIEPDSEGAEQLWVGSTDDGVGLFAHGRWQQFNASNAALPASDVRSIVRAPDDAGESALWAGLHFGHLVRIHEGPRFETIATPWEKHEGQALMHVLGRRIDGHQERWFATRQSGIYRWRDGAWTGFRPETAVGQWRTTKLLEQIDSHGRSWLWASSNQGLARFDGEQWTLLGREAGLPDVDFLGLSMIADAAGHPVLWLGSLHSGIVRVDVSDPMHPMAVPAGDLPRPPDPTAYSATRDSKGRIYVCTNNGVQLLTPGSTGYTSRVFARRDGMVHEECNTNAQFVDAHDRFWTGTLGGLTVFDPQREITDRHAKPLKLTQLRINGAEVSANQLRVPPGARDVRLEYALLSWQREGESRFRTQLVGYETEPSTWVPQNFRTFNALPAGQYVLRVEGRDYAGNLSIPLEIAIEIVPTWWQQTWARVLFALATLLAAYGVVQWRTRNLQAQRRRLEHKVAQRTTELHEANTRLRELSYRDALTGLANRRHLLESLELVDTTTEGTKTALIFVDVDHFKNYNDRFGHPAGDEALRCVAEVMRACSPPQTMVARYGGEEFACLLPDTDLARARDLAERIRAAVAECKVPVPGTDAPTRVTISAGVACSELESTADAHRLLRDADIALYQAKRDGRNCVRG